ncbi:c-type cytochrome [Candidatus Pelagisphaera phototrophica]|uniref:c-type cytochrome n=1 Tax=Candidatus Pelagisphaera phototrophica TaxID=2684113 RepID=UPI0019F8B441|nr:c-type cytochrome [Candidatus Pelagisphaera phototrophica]QXD33490.1 c-type cytochrome [Candidatus Pelagisphaera phototrophica]
MRKVKKVGLAILGTLLYCSFLSGASESSTLQMLARAIANSDNESVQISLMKGMLKSLEGRRGIDAPESWVDVRGNVSSSDNAEAKRLLQELSQIFGDEDAALEALNTVRNQSANAGEREGALRSLLAQRNDALAIELETLLDDRELRTSAIRAFGIMPQPGAAQLLLNRYRGFDMSDRRVVIETLATRIEYARELLGSLRSGAIEKSEIPTYAARTLESMLGSDFSEVYGDAAALSGDKGALFEKYRKLLTPEIMTNADPFEGKVVFDRTCAACHLMYGEGGEIGPDLTGSNRANLDYILLNILDPSADIPDSYKMVTVTTHEGQTLVGSIAEENGRRIVLNSVGQKQIVAKQDIKSRVVSDISMMPEGLLMTLKDDEVANLIQYLRTEEPLGGVKLKWNF